MAEKGFFDIINNYNPMKEVVPLAIQKFHMDMEQSKFDLAAQEAKLNLEAKTTALKNKTLAMDELKALGPSAGVDDVLNIGLKYSQLPFAEYAKTKEAIIKSNRPKIVGNVKSGIASVPVEGGAPTVLMQPQAGSGGTPSAARFLSDLNDPNTTPEVKAAAAENLRGLRNYQVSVTQGGKTAPEPNEARWVAVLNNPKSTPEEKEEAQSNLDSMRKQKVAVAQESRAPIPTKFQFNMDTEDKKDKLLEIVKDPKIRQTIQDTDPAPGVRFDLTAYGDKVTEATPGKETPKEKADRDRQFAAEKVLWEEGAKKREEERAQVRLTLNEKLKQQEWDRQHGVKVNDELEKETRESLRKLGEDAMKDTWAVQEHKRQEAQRLKDDKEIAEFKQNLKPTAGDKVQLSDTGKLDAERQRLDEEYNDAEPDRQIAISNRLQEIDKEIEKKTTPKEATEKAVKPPGSLAEFEEFYKKKGGKLEAIVGTPKYAEAWKEFVGTKSATTSEGGEKGRSNAMGSVVFTKREEKFVDNLSRALAEERTTPRLMQSALSSGGFGGTGRRQAINQEVWNRVYDLRPDYNPANAEVNFKAKESTFAINRVQLAKTVRPIAEDVKSLAAKIPKDFGAVPLQEQAVKIRKLLNNKDLAMFEYSKNKMVEEFERMLTGSQMADTRITRNLDLIRNGYDPSTIVALADQTLKYVQAAEKGVTSNMLSTGTQGKVPAVAGEAAPAAATSETVVPRKPGETVADYLKRTKK